MLNIHITLTSFENESRLIKEVYSLRNNNIYKKILIYALHGNELEENQILSDGIEVKRFKLYTRNLPRILLFQFFKYVEFLFRIIINTFKYKVSAVNVHSLSLLPLGIILKYISKCKLIYDAHELETEIDSNDSFRKHWAKNIERFCIYKCDMIIVVSESIADWYLKTYGIERPLVVKNAPWSRKNEKKNLFREIFDISHEQKILLYQGGLVKGRGISLILDAFLQRSANDVVMVFMGYGEMSSYVLQKSKLNKNIFFHPAVPPHNVLDYTSSADFGISLIEDICLSYYYCLPNKLFEYAMVGLPVIVSNMEEMANTVKNGKFGLVISDYSPKSINSTIDKLLTSNLLEYSKNALKFSRTNSWERQEIVLISGYKSMLQK